MGGAVVGAAVTTFGAWLGGTTGWAALAKVFFVSFFINKAASMIADDGIGGASAFDGNNRTTTVRQSAAPRKIILGETRVGGIYTFVEETDKDRYLQIVITLSGHECDDIGEGFFDGKKAINANGNPVSKYRGERVSGTYSIVNNSQIEITNPSASESFNQQGFRHPTIVQVAGFNNSENNGFFRVTGINVDTGVDKETLTLDTNSLVNESDTSGVTIRADHVMVEKRNGQDNQSALTGLQRITDKWTSNHRQRGCAHVHLVLRWDKSLFAAGVPNPTFMIKGKNDIYDPRDESTGYSNNVALCTANYLTDTRLGLGVDYDEDVNEAALVAAANDCDESVDLAGGGTQVRYTCNGRLSTDATPRENLSILCSAMAISAPVYSGGQWIINAGTYKTPTVSFNDDNVRGRLVMATKSSRREVFNAVKGTFFGPKFNYQEHGFPPVTNSLYESEDGELIWKNITLPLTDTPGMAQRIAKIELERARQQIQLQYPMDLSSLKVRAGNVILLDLERFGFDDKPFEIQEWSFNVGNDGLLGTVLDLRETASGIYDWNSGEETTVDLAPDTNLPDPTDMDPVSNLQLQSGTDQLWIRKDGTVQSAILATWDAPDEGFVEEFEVQVKKSADEEWRAAGGPQGGINQWRITDVEDGIAHDVRVRIVSVFLSESPWTTELNHIVIGKTAVPSDVADFSAQQNRELVTFKWPQVSDKDLSGYEIRYDIKGEFVWDGATVVTSVTKGTLVTNAAIPPGVWTVGIKARDTSGNYSENATTSDITVINEFDIIDSSTSNPNWLGSTEIEGTPTGVVHHVSGRLVPESQDLADGDNQDVFDSFVINPVPELRYTTREFDIGFDNSVRVWNENKSYAGPGESGDFDVDFYLAYKEEGEAEFTLEPWAGGTTNARYFKGQLRVFPGGAAPYVGSLKTTVDTLERTERHDDFDVSSGGTTLTFNREFHIKPNVEISSGTSGAYPFWSNKTTTSVDIEMFDSAGDPIAGVVDVKLTGA